MYHNFLTHSSADGQLGCMAPKAGALGQPRGIGCGGWWEGVQDRADTHIPGADSC